MHDWTAEGTIREIQTAQLRRGKERNGLYSGEGRVGRIYRTVEREQGDFDCIVEAWAGKSIDGRSPTATHCKTERWRPREGNAGSGRN